MTYSARLAPRKIESRHNARVKELRAGLLGGANREGNSIAIEGEHLLREALRSQLRVTTVFVRAGEEALLESIPLGSAEVLILSAEIFSSAASLDHPQGIAALVEPPQFEFESMLGGTPLLVVAAGLQDPGNLGTLVRSAEAFGATGMILFPGTVSLWNPKALRASAGSAFRLPAFAMPPEKAFVQLRAHGIRLLAAVPRDGISPTALSGPVAFLLGNEGGGLPESWIAQADARMTIPCPGPVESLNAAIAGSVLLYEAARQRQASQSSGARESV